MNSEINKPEKYFIGTYLYPLTFLNPPDFSEPSSSAQIITNIHADNTEVLITRMGGLFTAIPTELIGQRYTPEGHGILDHIQSQLGFEQQACNLFNLIICEMCLKGVISEPSTPSYLGIGEVKEERIFIRYPASSNLPYYERPLSASRILSDPDELLIASLHHNYDIVAQVSGLNYSNELSLVSSSLPGFIASAYSSFSRHHINEALLNSWIACEQLLNYLWSEYIDNVSEKNRKIRLKDSRTYTAAIKTEVLSTAGVLDQDLSESLHKARRNRNNLAHNAENDYFSTKESVDALKNFLAWFLKDQVEDFEVPSGPMWRFEIPE